MNLRSSICAFLVGGFVAGTALADVPARQTDTALVGDRDITSRVEMPFCQSSGFGNHLQRIYATRVCVHRRNFHDRSYEGECRGPRTGGQWS